MIGPWLVLAESELAELGVEASALAVSRRGLPGGRTLPHVDVYLDSRSEALLLIDEYGLCRLRESPRTLVAEGRLSTASADIGMTVFAEAPMHPRDVDNVDVVDVVDDERDVAAGAS